MTKEADKLRQWVEESGNIVFFGGAGVSTESNIPDFRSKDGIYSAVSEYGYPPEQMLSATFFSSHKKIFYEYYKKHLLYPDAQPNAAHKGLALLESQGKLKAVITQNIDNLHQKAGSRNVLELHGTLYRNYCVKCGKPFSVDYVLQSEEIPKCDQCGGVVRPDIVLYEEGLDQDTLISSARFIEQADMLIVGGTSLNVYPAAGLIQYYKGHKLVLINQSVTSYDDRADLILREKIGEVFRQICEIK